MEETHESHYDYVRYAQPAYAVVIRLHLDAYSEFPKTCRTDRYIRPQLYREHALHAGQTGKIEDSQAEARMVREMVRLMQENDAPAEQYERLGLN
jgi:hypothetical protein